MKFKRLFFLLLIFFISQRIFATHIVGGDISYICLGSGTYEITLKLYRDCLSGGAAFDDPAFIHAYDAQGNLLQSIPAWFPVITPLQPFNDPCMQLPPGICVEEGWYVVTANLPDITGGYTLVYQRCCRNPTIINITNPGGTGATYTATIPDPAMATCNNSPRFQNYPPIVICANEPFSFDHSALDADADQLVYSLCAAWDGATDLDPNPAVPYPWNFVQYVGGYSSSYPIDASPVLAIDPVTGQLTLTATTLGQYVIAICVDEFRNGQLIGNYKRDFQFNVVNCQPFVVASTQNFVLDCEDFTVNFVNMSSGTIFNYHWDFGVPWLSNDTSNINSPSYTYPDTGIYFVTLVLNNGYVCDDSTVAEIHIFPSLASDFDFVAGCSYDPVLFTDQSQIIYGNIISWLWDFGDGTSDSIPSPSHLYAFGDQYAVTLTVESDKGCTETITKTVDVLTSPTVLFNTDTVCFGKTAVLKDLSTFINGVLDFRNWDLGDGTFSDDEIVYHHYPAPGNYSVTLILMSESGCSDTMTKPIFVAPPAAVEVGPDLTLMNGNDTLLTSTGNGIYFEWAPVTFLDNPFTAQTVCTPTVTTTYVLLVRNDFGCFGWDSLTVHVNYLTQLYIPNAFSPNNDELNDVFRIGGMSFGELDLKIFDRWGNLVFETRDALEGWNGKFKGRQMEIGVYTNF